MRGSRLQPPCKVGNCEITGFAGRGNSGELLYWVICPKCGKTVKKRNCNLHKVKSCRLCSRKTHGLSKTPEYRTWIGILRRCYNKKCPSYKYYGKKGIKACKRWHKFENFFEDMGKRPRRNWLGSKYSLDRIDSRGDYCKQNCRWVTEGYNTRRTKNEYLYISKRDLSRLPEESLSLLGLKRKDLIIDEFIWQDGNGQQLLIYR